MNPQNNNLRQKKRTKMKLYMIISFKTFKAFKLINLTSKRRRKRKEEKYQPPYNVHNNILDQIYKKKLETTLSFLVVYTIFLIHII